MTLTFIGHGYVGLVTACVFANLGNQVFVIGRDPQKIKKLQLGDPIIYEPGLAEMLKKNLDQKRISFTLSYEKSISQSEAVFIAVGTPTKKNGETDLKSVYQVAYQIGKNLGKKYTLVVCKSTVPVGTNRKIFQILKKSSPKYTQFDIASCPEFLREGSAIYDTIYPDRIVIGADSDKAINLLKKIHEPLEGKRVVVGIESAELIKYASNSMLATKISFANLISFICEESGANIQEVLEGVGLDQRIGRSFLNPGVGYGGSCLPKDVKSFISTGKKLRVDMSLFESVEKINQEAQNRVYKKIIKYLSGKTIAIWGLSFKPNTDDIREAPSLFIIKKLLEKKYKINAYDPAAMENIKMFFGNKINFFSNPYEAIKNASLLVILTEWDEFKQINLEKVAKLMKNKIIIDGRNIYQPPDLKKKGFLYVSVGRPYS